MNPVRICLWQKDALALGGVLSWMWRVRENFKDDAHVSVCNVDLRVIPLPEGQLPLDAGQFFNVRVDSAREFVAFLKQNGDALHVVNYAFEYLDIIDKICPQMIDRLRFVGTCHTDQGYYYLNLIKYRKFWGRILTVSPRTQEVCRTLFPELGDKVVMLPYGNIPIPEQIHPTPPGAKLRLLYLGRLCQEQKRVMDLVELMSLLKDTPCQLTVVGEGNKRDKLVEEMKPFGDKVIFKPAVPVWEVDAEYSQHDIFVMTSEYEGNSIALMEGMVMGLAPFITEFASGRERIKPGVNGVTVPVGDMQAMAQQISAYQKRPDELQKMKAAAQETMVEELRSLAYKEKLTEFLCLP